MREEIEIEFDPDKVAAQTALDEFARERTKFVYTYDVLGRKRASYGPTWVIPNKIVKGIIRGDIDLGSLPPEGIDGAINEVQIGLFLLEQSLVVDHYRGDTKLCEALGARACMQGECPFYEPGQEGGERVSPVCRQYKLMFPRHVAKP